MIVNPYPRIQGEVISTYQLIQLDGASYGFAKSPSGYYFNCNGGIAYSAAVARFNFNLLEQTTIIFEYINNAETNCDYGLISEVDKSFTFDWNDNSNSAEAFSSSSSTAQTYSMVVPKGEHFIDIKFTKDSSVNNNYDSFLIKIINEELRELPPQQTNNYGLATSDKILKGNRVIGANGYPILGTGLSQTTSATSSEILSGYTAYSNSGSYITGTYIPTTTSSAVNIWAVLDVGTTYGFDKTSDGYYTSTNAGVNSSASLCKVNLQMAEAGTITIQCINYAESNYDYGLIGNIDTVLTDTFSDDSNVQKSFKGSSSSTAQSYSFDVSAGEHFIYIKYRKDSSQASGNDSFKFKITSGASEYYMGESDSSSGSGSTSSGYEFGDYVLASTGSNFSTTSLTFTVDTNNLDGFLIILNGDTYISNTDNQIVSIYLNPKDKELNVGLAKYNSSSREVNYYSYTAEEGYYDSIVTMSSSTLQLDFTSKNYYFMMAMEYRLFPIYKT